MIDPRVRVIHAGGESVPCILEALDATVEVRLPAVAEWRHQLMALTLAEILGRVARRLVLRDAGSTDADRRLPPGPRSLAERFETSRARGMEPLPADSPAVTVAIGAAGPADVHVDGDGWMSYLGSQPTELASTGSVVPIGPLIAAARGAERVVALLLYNHVVSPPPTAGVYSSALSYETRSTVFDEPAPDFDPSIDMVMFGAGSVGGAAAYAFAHTPELGGSLDIVDPETLVRGDFVKAILASREASTAELGKADMVKHALEHLPALAVRPHRQTARAFVAGRSPFQPLPLVLCAVDSVASRREIQDCGPLDLINAACNADEVVVSGHRTDDGPCVYCLHVPDVLDASRIRWKLIAGATGFGLQDVLALSRPESRLSPEHVRRIEQHRAVVAGSLSPYIGGNLDELYRAELMYGEHAVPIGDSGLIAVPRPSVTAAAGFLLAGEALKAAGGRRYQPFRLGRLGRLKTMYRESLMHGPATAFLTDVNRHDGVECLCRSTRRLRLVRTRYGLRTEHRTAA